MINFLFSIFMLAVSALTIVCTVLIAKVIKDEFYD